MSISVASLDRDLAVDESPFARAPTADTFPTAVARSATILLQEESIARAGEDISSLLVLIPVGLLALMTFGTMLTPF